MIDNLKGIRDYVDALIELKKEQLRQCVEQEQLLVKDLKDLEDAKSRLNGTTFVIPTNVVPNEDIKKPIKQKQEQKEKVFNVDEIIKWIVLNGPVTYEDICIRIGQKKVPGLGANLGKAVKKGKLFRLEGGRFAAHRDMEVV